MNEIYVAAICHDIVSNTLEATWLQNTGTELKRVKCRNYIPEQKDEFLDDLNTFGTPFDGTKYVTMAGW